MLVTYQITLSNHSLSLLLQKNTNNRTFRATKFPRCDNFIRIPEIHIHRASTVQVSFLSDYRVIGNIIRGGKDIYIYTYIYSDFPSRSEDWRESRVICVETRVAGARRCFERGPVTRMRMYSGGGSEKFRFSGATWPGARLARCRSRSCNAAIARIVCPTWPPTCVASCLTKVWTAWSERGTEGGSRMERKGREKRRGMESWTTR